MLQTAVFEMMHKIRKMPKVQKIHTVITSVQFQNKNTHVIMIEIGESFAHETFTSIGNVKIYCDLKFVVSEIECISLFGTLV